VNIFVLGWSREGRAEPARAARAVEQLLAQLPFLPGAAVSAWGSSDGRACAAWACHAPDLVGGIEYAQASGDELALFAGRPIAWRGGQADGGVIRDPAAAWELELDGRYALVRARGGELEARADALGAYPLYETEADGTWISNCPGALLGLAPALETDSAALAGLLGGGWPLDGHPVWAAIRRRRAEVPRQRLGAGLDVHAAADALVEATRALADWPGRPSIVPLTGGRDSRLVLAAALKAGFDFETVTGGSPEDEDARVARELADRAGVPHSLLPPDPVGNLWSHPVEAARTLMSTAGGTASLADAAGFPLAPRPGLLPLWHTGQGGEVGRAYYPAALTRRRALAKLERAYLGRRPGRRGPLAPPGERLIRESLESWASERLAAGARPRALADLFYLDRRMATWAAPTHGAVEWVRDSTSPLWSSHVVPHLLAGSRGEREAEGFHRAVLRHLAPELAEIPFADSAGWRSRSAAVRRARSAAALAGKARRQLARRIRTATPTERNVLRQMDAEGSSRAGGSDSFAEIQRLVREAAASRAGHPAWGVLDRDQVEALLSAPPASLDTMSRYYVLRLATILLADVE